MKTIFIAAPLFLLFICGNSACQAQQNACGDHLSPIFSLSAGTPYNLYAEGGIMGYNQRVGISAGVKLFTQASSSAKNNAETSDVVEPYARISFRISNESASLFRQYLTGWYGLNGIRGVSYRLGMILSDFTMLAIEPNYSRENRLGVNVTLLAKLN